MVFYFDGDYTFMFFKNLWKKIRYFVHSIEQRVPYIPDFGDVSTILKLLLVSFLICILYTFTQVNYASDFYSKFTPNLSNFFKYVIAQVLLLIAFSKLIRRQKPLKAILFIIFSNFISVCAVHFATTKDLTTLWTDMDGMFAKFVVSYGILFFFLIYFDWREKNLDPSNIMAKLIFLQSKMKPHFLFNTLNTVIALIKKEPDTARKMLLNFSDLLRVSIKEEEVSMYTIKEELNLCKKYFEIEKIRLGNRLNIEWNIDEELTGYLIPKLALQPLIENSILHGIQHVAENGQIEVTVRNHNEDKIFIEIKNDINKQKNYREEDHNNISMDNLRERLKIYYSGNVDFKSYEKNKKFYVYLLLPKKLSKELIFN